jgi:hypothetical protein
MNAPWIIDNSHASNLVPNACDWRQLTKRGASRRRKSATVEVTPPPTSSHLKLVDPQYKPVRAVFFPCQ